MYKRLRLSQLGEEIKAKKDPISRYNLVIEQYNDPVNRKQEIFLKKAHNFWFYKFWYTIQTKCMFFLLIMYLIPYINLLVMFFNLINEIIQEFANFTYISNQKKNKDILENMVHDVELCNRGSADFLYYEVHPDNLESFKLKNDDYEKIMMRSKSAHDGKVRFMVFNNKFKAGYENLPRARYITFIQLLLNVMVFIVIQFYVYETFLCFDLFKPSQKPKDCYSDN